MNAINDTIAFDATVDRDALHDALQALKRVAEKTGPIPILSYVLLTCDKSKLRLRTTDLALEAIASIACESASPGASLAVPVYPLADIVKNCAKGARIALREGESKNGKRYAVDKNGEQYAVDTLEPRLRIFSGHTSVTLDGRLASDFPETFKDATDPCAFALPAANLRDLIGRTRFAISTEETRYYLHGAYLHVIDNALRAVTTDGHRLARMDRPLPSGAGTMPGVIVPTRCLDELRKLIAKVKEPVNVRVSPAKISFQIGEFTLNSKLIDGAFPDYARVIPHNYSTRMTVERDALAAAVRGVSVILSQRGPACKLSMENDLLTISVKNPDTGEIKTSVHCYYDGPLFEIGFNTSQLLNQVAAFAGDTVTFLFGGPSDPALVEDSGESAFLSALMPIRI
jgi:DNA polymerase-3 subunit beta